MSELHRSARQIDPMAAEASAETNRKRKARTRELLLAALIVMFVAAVWYAIAPPHFDPDDDDIRATFAEGFGVELSGEIEILHAERWEAPLFQIQGVIFSEDSTVRLADHDFEVLHDIALRKYSVGAPRDEELAWDMRFRDGAIYFGLDPTRREITYHYVER